MARKQIQTNFWLIAFVCTGKTRSTRIRIERVDEIGLPLRVEYRSMELLMWKMFTEKCIWNACLYAPCCARYYVALLVRSADRHDVLMRSSEIKWILENA